ncbi:MAG: isochorismatase family protein [Alphaproteobacteria bacterium]|nr:isochorismatase family protein [Alphaproteobacteria bacterium]
MARIWDSFLTERDKQVFEASGHGQRAGFGERPALLVIDVNYNFCGDKPEPILTSIERWPHSCGEDAWTAIPVIRRLLEVGRRKRLPIFYSTNDFRADGFDLGGWSLKAGRINEDVTRAVNGNAIVAEIAPADRDVIVYKKKPSVFHGTPLLDYLISLKVDSIVFAGTTTSGCVRAAVIDAFSYNFRCTIVEDACFDRSIASHAINLCDMNAKYGDVIGSGEAIGYLETVANDLFPQLGSNAPSR